MRIGLNTSIPTIYGAQKAQAKIPEENIKVNLEKGSDELKTVSTEQKTEENNTNRSVSQISKDMISAGNGIKDSTGIGNNVREKEETTNEKPLERAENINFRQKEQLRQYQNSNQQTNQPSRLDILA